MVAVAMLEPVEAVRGKYDEGSEFYEAALQDAKKYNLDVFKDVYDIAMDKWLDTGAGNQWKNTVDTSVYDCHKALVDLANLHPTASAYAYRIAMGAWDAVARPEAIEACRRARDRDEAADDAQAKDDMVNEGGACRGSPQ